MTRELDWCIFSPKRFIMDYIAKRLTVVGRRGRKAVCMAIVDTACPWNVLPKPAAERAGVKLGPVVPSQAMLAGKAFNYREGMALVSLTGGCSGTVLFRVPEGTWHGGRFSGHALLGSRFFQACGAKIDYSKRSPKGGHPVRCNPPLESFGSYDDPGEDGDPTRFLEAGLDFVVCPKCHAPVFLTSKAFLRRHFVGPRGRRKVCPGSVLRVVRRIEGS